MFVPSQDHSELLKRLAGLPPFSRTGLRLLSISIDSETAVEDYETAFRSDPALATDLLRAANSVEFGLMARVDSVRQAITLLGLDFVSSLAVTVSMRQYMNPIPRPNLMQPLWAHSVAAAVIGETLGRIRGGPASGLYTAGLVHDMGRLGLLMETEYQYAKLLAQPVAGIQEAAALEREQFGLTHAEVGAIMAKSWGFPVWLCNAIRYHHEEEGQPSDERVKLVQLACRSASALGYGEHGDAKQRDKAGGLELPPDLRGRAALEPDRLRQSITKMLSSISGRT